MHNIVKSFFSGTKTNATENQTNATEEQLAVSHLKRVFEGYKNGRHQLEPVLPTFCRAFKSAPATVINEKFPEITEFSKCVSAELVLKITRTASCKSLREGSYALFQLLKTSQWNALCTVNIAALSLSAVKQMCQERLPSTFVKMLYLLMDLPDLSHEAEHVETISQMLMSVLIRIGEHVCVVEELRSKDNDLMVLFDICTSTWERYNAQWQRCAVEFLTTVCRKSLTYEIIDYLIQKKCLTMCIKNIQIMSETHVMYVADTILPIFGCLKDSCTITDTLLTSFKESGGYVLLTEAIINLELYEAVSEGDIRVKNECLNKLTYSIPTLCTAGVDQVVPEIHAKSMQFQRKDFCVPAPTMKGASVRNPAAFIVLQEVFLKCKTEHLSLLTMDVINAVYRLDEVNYFILNQHNTLNCFIAESLTKATQPVQERILKLLEHVVFVLRYIPSSELEALIILLKDSPDVKLASLILATLNKLITADPDLKLTMLKLGLLNTLQFCQIQLLQLSMGDTKIDDEYLSMLMTTLNTMIDNCPLAYQSYSELQGRDFLYDMLHEPSFRCYVLLVIKTLSTHVNVSEDQDNVRSLLHMIQENPTNTELKLDILDCLSELFLSFPPSQHRFQITDGFLFISNLIVSAAENDKENYIQVVGKVLALLQASLHHNPSNIYFFETEVEYSSLTRSLELLPCFSEVHEEAIINVFRQLMTLALDLEQEIYGLQTNRVLFNDTVLVSKHDNLVHDMEYYDRSIVYPKVFITMLVLTRLSKSEAVLISVCEWVLQMTLLPHNLQLLSDSKFLTTLLALFSNVFTDPTHKAYVRVVNLFEVLARHKLYPDQLRLFLRLDNPLYCVRPETTVQKLTLDLTPMTGNNEVDIENGQLVMDTSQLNTGLSRGVSVQRETSEDYTEDSSTEVDQVDISVPADHVTEKEEEAPVLLPTQDEIEVKTRRVSRVQFKETVKNEDSASQNSSLLDEDDVVEIVDEDTVGGAPVIISVEEIERLKTEMAINFNEARDEGVVSCSEDSSNSAFSDEEDEEEGALSGDAGEGFRIRNLPKHHVELLVSVSTPVDGTQEAVPYISITPHIPSPGFIIPYLLKPGSAGFDKLFQNSFTLTIWFQIPPSQNTTSWQITLLHSATVKLTLLNGKINVVSGETMQSHDTPPIKDDAVWHMMVATFSKGTKIRSSGVEIMIDLDWKASIKTDYPNLLLDNSALHFGMSPAGAPSSISWNLGCIQLHDGALSASDVNTYYAAGPSYIGNMRVDGTPEGGVPIPFLNINPGTRGVVMLDSVLDQIEEATRRFLTKQEGIDLAHASTTPLQVFPNLSSHLVPYDVTPCAIALYQCHVISPSSIGTTFEAVGSVQVLLGLVAMASDSGGLYAAIKLLTLVVNSNSTLRQGMEDSGYEILALLLHRKANIATTHVLQLVTSLGSCSGTITHPTAVKVLLCSFEVWREAAEEIQSQLCTCIYNLVTNPRNLDHIENMEVTERLLELVYDGTISWALVQAASEVISAVISTASGKVLRTFGCYLVYSLPTSLVNENEIKEVSHVVKIRNMLLELLCVLVQSGNMNNDFRLLSQVEETLGFDWLLLFLRPGLHQMTFTMALRLTTILLSPAKGFHRFSHKVHHGGWLHTTPAPPQPPLDPLQGFPLLLHVLKGHTRLAEFSSYSLKIYSWLISLTLDMDQPPSSLTNDYNLEKTFHNKYGVINKDPLVVLLCLIREDIDDKGFEAVVRYLIQLYNNDTLAHSAYLAVIELFVALLWVPSLEPTRDLILRRGCVVELLLNILLSELFRHNFDMLDIILEPCVVEFGDSIDLYQSTLLYGLLRRLQTGAPDGVSTKHFNKAAIYFCKYILHKIWQGKLSVSTDILSSFSKLSEWISKEAESQVTFCLHRAILFYLSQDSTTVEGQKQLLKVIHFVYEHHAAIFNPAMEDYEFVICYSHLSQSLNGDGEWGRMLDDAAHAVLTAVKTARPDLTPYLEPGSEITLLSANRGSKSGITSLFTGSDSTSSVIQHEIAPKLFCEIKRQMEEGDKVIHQQRSSRRFTGLLTPRRQETQLTLSTAQALNVTHDVNYGPTTHVMCRVSDNLKESVHSTQLQFHRVQRIWSRMQLELTIERGLWGPTEASHLDRWELDHVEGPHRTRKRLKINTGFYNVFQPKSHAEYKVSKFKQPSSSFSREYHHYYGTRDRVSSLTTIGGASKMSQLISARTLDADNRLMQDFLLPGESRIMVFPCIRVEGLTTTASILYLGRKSAYIVDGYTTTKQGDIMDVQMLMPEEWSERFKDILVESASLVIKNKAAHGLNYKRITEIVKRRYSLQENGMEVFCHGGQSYFLVFNSNHRDKACHKLKYLTPSLTQKSDFASDVLSSARRHTRGDGSSVFNTFRQSNVTQRWCVGEISNFQYLMYVNTLAGRSYKDLMQYPIFPWVLADYESEELDLTDPATFRDLSKPMGAQTPERLAQFEKRYADWVDPHGTDTNPCHYGTFYSSAMITSGYLIRLEPFTSSFIALQGGHFDLADRLFHSIGDAWNSASRVNMCDVRELIPEFFYLPDFLTNTDKFDFGRKQNGKRIGNVELPKWAKGDPGEFIRLHREALESDYVSKNLHHWVDLIFGYKQRGNQARLNHNTFHCYFYEGSIDISLLTDSLRKSAVKGFINNFGQAPKQIFTRPHPQRQISYSDLVLRTFHYNVVNLKPPVREERVISSSVQQIESTENGGTLFAGKNKVLVPTSTGFNYYFTWGLPDNSLLLGAVDGKILQIYEHLEPQRVLCAVCPDNETLLLGGEYSYISVYTHTLSYNKDTRLTIKKKLYGHSDMVTCMSASDNYRMFVSGSADKTVIMWDLNRLTFTRQLPSHPERITAVFFNEVSGEILTAAKSHLYLWTINGDLAAQTALPSSSTIQVCTQTTVNEWDRNNVVVTGSTDGIVRIWGLLFRRNSENRWERTLTCRSRLTIYTSFERPDNRHPAGITCLRFSEDHVTLFVGDSRGRVFCWAHNDSTGKQADHWVLDSGSKECAGCGVTFSFVERRHHCRECGLVFCNSCSNFYRTIPQRNITHKVRVCKKCSLALSEN